MNIILFDNNKKENLLPFSFTRPLSEIRCGIFTIKEKWEQYLNSKYSFITSDYLKIKYPINIESDNLLINGALLPNNQLVDTIKLLHFNQVLVDRNNRLLAGYIKAELVDSFDEEGFLLNKEVVRFEGDCSLISNIWDIFLLNEEEIEHDFILITKGKKSQPISSSNKVIGDVNRIFIEEGAIVECAILNVKDSWIYIGKDAEIMEGAIVRGSLAMCEHSVLKMGAKIYGATTLGPHCKVGGEVSNVVFFGYSNKAHDGFLGNAVIGEWCNIGADSNNSNLKNNYASVKVWNYPKQSFVNTGLQFCGLFMGDHSKCGINTMFNTGTVVGVSSNIYGSGFPRNFVPSFSWGGAAGFVHYELNKAKDVAKKMYQRRGMEFGGVDEAIFDAVYFMTKEFRDFV